MGSSRQFGQTPKTQSSEARLLGIVLVGGDLHGRVAQISDAMLRSGEPVLFAFGQVGSEPTVREYHNSGLFLQCRCGCPRMFPMFTLAGSTPLSELPAKAYKAVVQACAGAFQDIEDALSDLPRFEPASIPMTFEIAELAQRACEGKGCVAHMMAASDKTMQDSLAALAK